MDFNTLVGVLANTLKPELREESEVKLNEAHKIIEFSPRLLRIVMSDQVPMPVRQAGVIYLKNTINQNWEIKSADASGTIPFSIHESDKQFIRDNIIDAVIQAPDPVRVQLTVCISQMVKHDFPGKWPGIAVQVANILAADKMEAWLGATLSLYQLIKFYEYKKQEERTSLNEAMRVILPLIYNRALQLSSDVTEPSILIQKQILKCFYALVQNYLPLDLISKEIFAQWMSLVREIVIREVPEQTNQVDEDERPNLPWWKCKKWAMHILARVFERYGSPGKVLPDYEEFSTWYIKSFSGGIIEVLVKMLDQYRQKVYIAPRVIQQTLNYLNEGVSHSLTWKLMKPHLIGIISEIVFPLMCHNEEDQELWESDPVEYIRLKYDVFEEFFSPVMAAQALMHSACSTRKEVLQKTMEFVMTLLTSPTLEPHQKAGALHMVGGVADILLKKKIYKDQIELLLLNHVFPVFNSEHGYLRARACWVLHYFSEVKFKNDANLQAAVNHCRHALCVDKELPVKVEAAIAIQMLLTEQAKARDLLKPHIRDVIFELLNVIRETENDDLTNVMQKIVCTYSEEIIPLAVEMTTHLAQIFANVIENDAESDEKAITAMGILNTLETLVNVMEDQKEILQHVEGIVMNVIGLILQRNLIEYYEELLSLIYSLTCTVISERMWQVFPMLYELFNHDNTEYFTDMMPALHNYVTVDGKTFLSNPSHLETIYNMCKRVLTGDLEEDAECHAAKLLEVVILQYRGQIDNVILTFVELALERLTRNVLTAELRTMCLQVVIAALYYNPQMLLENLTKIKLPNTSNSILDQFIKQWIHDSEYFLGLHDRKLSVLGLCHIIQTPSNRPQVITEAGPQILPAMLQLFSGLQRAYTSRAETETDSEEEEGEEEIYNGGELEDEEDDIDEESKQYYEKLDKSINGEEEDEDEEDLDDDENETQLESYQTPLDADDCPDDEYQIFKQVLRNCEATDPSWFSILTNNLNQKQQQELQQIFTLADQRKAVDDSKKIEQQGGYVFNQQTVPTNFNFCSP